MRARVIDTSVLIASMDGGAERQAEAKGLIAEAGPLVIPNEVLVETLGVLKTLVGRAAARRFQKILVETEGVELGHETDMAAALLLLDNFPKLSIVNACAVTLAWRINADLDTFDVQQRIAWSSR